MEKIKLKMNIKGSCVYVDIDDIDRSLLIDVINELYDEVMKHKISLPKHPTLSYYYNMECYELLDDKDLLQMFSRFEGNEVIEIWIGCGSTPSTVLQMARKLVGIDTGVDEGLGNDEPQIRQKLCVRRKVTTDESFVEHVVTTQNSRVSQEPVLSPLRCEGMIENVTIEPIIDVSPPPKKAKTPNSSVRRSPSFTKNTELDSCATEKQAPASQTEEPTFKLSRSTAKLKGVFVPTAGGSGKQHCEGGSRLRTRTKRVQGTTMDHGGVGSDNDGSDSDNISTDNSYTPTDEDVCDEEVSDLDDEDNTIISTLDRIDDGYDPYQSTEWAVEEEGLTAKMYANGEIYDEKEFGTINLRPWMLFMDKAHFRDTLKDFCIQEGFHIIVLRADRFRYTAECATVGCEWRIHASVLQDGTTWALKSIRMPDHGCVGVKNHNPLANADWVAKKIIEDIRANPAIDGTSIQNIIMERYGLHMKSSTLYRMKEKALKLINGGHDASYGLLPAYCEMVKKTNPDSYAICAWTEMENPVKSLQFKSIFVSFSAQFKGLIGGCRSLIGVDGTHLKGNAK